MPRKLIFLYDTHHSSTEANISYANVSLVVKPEKLAGVDETVVSQPMDMDHSREKEEMEFKVKTM